MSDRPSLKDDRDAIRDMPGTGIPRWLADGDEVFMRWRDTTQGVRCTVVCVAGDMVRIESLNPKYAEVNGWRHLGDLRVRMTPPQPPAAWSRR